MAPISWETYSKLCEFREHLIKIETILSFIKIKVVSLEELINKDMKYLEKFKITVYENGEIRGVRGKILKPLKYGKKNYSPYYGVDVKDYDLNKRIKSYPIHRLVAEAYLPDWNKDLQVNHIDGNKANNHYLNLEMCTQSENMRHAFKTGLITANHCKGENSSKAIFTNKQALEILNELKSAPRSTTGKIKRGFLVELAKKYNVKREQLKDFSRGRTTYSLMECNDYPEKEYTQVSGSAQHLEQVMI